MRGQPRCANVLDQTYPDRDLVLHRRQTHFPANDAKELVTPQEHYICMQKKNMSVSLHAHIDNIYNKGKIYNNGDNPYKLLYIQQ